MSACVPLKRRPMKAQARRLSTPRITIICTPPAPEEPPATSTGIRPDRRPTRQQQQQQSPIDVEAIEDDDEVEMLSSSSTGFPQARRRQPVTVNLEEEVEVNPRRSGGSINTRNKRERIPSNRTVINCEDSHDPKRKNAMKSPPKPPKEPTFTCPICMNVLVEASSTICGHIFCLNCLKTSIEMRKKCPICAKKLTAKSFHRVYLPSAE